jgi:hypothetical protein
LNRGLAAGLFLGPLLLLALPALAEESGLRPRLAVDEPVFESGELRPGEMFSHEFTLRNVGEAPLALEDVLTGCSCSVASYDRTIAPGGQGRVRLTVDVDRQWAGREFRRTVWVTTNDPEAAQISLVVRGRVAAEAGDGR